MEMITTALLTDARSFHAYSSKSASFIVFFVFARHTLGALAAQLLGIIAFVEAFAIGARVNSSAYFVTRNKALAFQADGIIALQGEIGDIVTAVLTDADRFHACSSRIAAFAYVTLEACVARLGLVAFGEAFALVILKIFRAFVVRLVGEGLDCQANGINARQIVFARIITAVLTDAHSCAAEESAREEDCKF